MACWPTAEEASAPGFNLSVWRGLWVPKDTPKPVIAKLNAAVGDALGAPAVKKALADIGQDIPVPEEQTAHARSIPKPKSKNGGRSSRPRISKWNDLPESAKGQSLH